jgi:tetratricopeptide (TPR) repeat protein/transcriptional regulator with XRE-family HTH domain
MDRADTVHPNDRLRQERIGHNWRQQDLADQLGTAALTVRRWERGSQHPSAYFRVKLCALFGKSAEELGLVEETLLLPTTPEREALGEILMRSSPAEKPALWTVPYRRNPYFTGRDDLLRLLDQHLEATSQGEPTTLYRATLTQPHAMKGLGGIGKTQIAVEYAYRAREHRQYTHTLWINAASQEAIMTSFTQLADVLPAFSAKNETNQQKLVAAIKQWMEQCQERWLLIFDNADDLSLVQEYVPSSGNGSILLTTRANAVGSLARSIDVDKMGFVEGTHLLLRRAQRFVQASDDEVNEAGNIVVALDHFPLALEQAGAYIEETGCSFSNYLKLYQTHRKTLLARRGAQSTNYPDSVATTWSLSFQKVEQANPAAADLLRLCAFLAPDHIPEELLTIGAPYWPPVLQQAAADPFAFDQMLETLLTFSLVKRLVENRLLSIHRLVQEVQLERMRPEERQQWAEGVVCAVNAGFPRDPKNETDTWSLCLRYLGQAQACKMLIEQWKLTLTEGADLLNRTAVYLCVHASYELAEQLYQQALSIREQSLGFEHPLVAHTLNDLAELYGEQGKYVEAEPLYRRAFHIWEQSLGPEHPQVAHPLNNLAVLYKKLGKYVEAESLYQHALSIWEQSLGPEHPHIASPLNNLGELYRAQGKYKEGEPLFRRALSIWEQSLGPEHPHIASPLHNLGLIYAEQGKYAEAEPLYQRAFHIWEQTLGPEHPNIAYSLHNLAVAYKKQGKYREAEPLFRKTLHIWEQSLGPEHPNIASSLNHLADLYQEQGKYREAEPLFQRALSIREQSLGLEHATVASSLTGLAELTRKQGKYREAEPLFQRALSIREHTLEPDHPDTADTLYGFAALREAQGNIEQATSLYCRALAIREKVYGLQHPKTTDTRERLDALLQARGKTEDVGSS